ncbi:zinc-dependent metalloprotease [Oceanitalea stevensii]|uniref:Zinc-dependent metalloprotease n=1 Tax=Oceanitalea stevensii TaxID=2763072 RepID=A0ABR8Z595_9MICO|nr:zinc-dependent metalloprotease [Oceanitalea stevensii]MBD8063178.1 zinc-dependent metalloprotease [Oceanitalea stevensii]
MSQDPAGEESWEALLRSMLGPQAADEAMAAMRAAGLDPEAMASAAGLPQDRNQLAMMLGQMQHILAAGGSDPVNWALAGDVATQVVRQTGDVTVTAAQAAEATEALRVADLWLDAVTELGPSGGATRAWSRSDWARETLPTWKTLAEPIATSVARALERVLEEQTRELGDHPLAAGLGAGAGGGMIRQLGGAVFGMQVGQAVGTLAGEAFGASDTGLPLVEGHDAALVPANVEAFAEGLDAPAEEVRLFLAVREVAHARLFAHVPWLRAHLLGTVEAYAREISIDTGAIEEAVRGLDPSDPESLREAFSGGVFALEQSDAQRAALVRLETALALVEGWVEVVAGQAVAPHLPHAVPLREMVRRRRAAGGPAEQTFASLVGLELRPRRLREAAALWTHLAEQRGVEARDALWSHPDLMPTAEELDDPKGFVAARDAAASADEDVDAALASIFAEAEQAEGTDTAQDEDAADDDRPVGDDAEGDPR